MSYRDLAKGAIAGLKERAGSSLPAIKKYLGLDSSKFRHLNAALAAGVKSGFFVENNGKYKLAKIEQLSGELQQRRGALELATTTALFTPFC